LEAALAECIEGTDAKNAGHHLVLSRQLAQLRRSEDPNCNRTAKERNQR
jgi:hypothetical protein